MAFNKFEAVRRSGRFLTGGTRTTNTLDALSNVGGSIMDAVVGGISFLPGVGIPLAGGAAIGAAMENNLPQSSFTSGRGSGARATNNPALNNPVRPSQPEGEQTVYARQFADLRGSVTPGSNEPASSNLGEGASMDNAERTRPGSGYPSGVQRPADYPVVRSVSSNDNGRNDTRTNPNGVVQTGTNMSRSFNELLGTVNKGQFSSNQLPTTNGNPFEGKPPETQTFNTDSESLTGNSYDNYAAAGGAAAVKPGANAGSAPFNPNAARIEGGSSRKPGGSLEEALNDSDGINSYMSQYSSGDRERMARRAFLDGEDSMSGLRAKEAVNGVVYAGGQHYMSDESGDDKAIAISRDQARGISSGKTNAQKLLQEHIDKNKEVTDGEPAESQNPISTFEQPPEGSPSVASASDYNLESSEFEMNNNDGNTGFEKQVNIPGRRTNFPLTPYK